MMQKIYTSELSFTITGENSEEIKQRLHDFITSVKKTEGVSFSIGNIVQIEKTTGITIEEVIASCAETNRIITEEEAHEILKQYNQGCIDNPGCDWFIVVEVLADSIIEER